MNQQGLPSVIQSAGNPLPHLILRGANHGPNYDLPSIQAIREKYKQNLPALVIDCSHGNSGKDPLRQPEVLQQIVAERLKHKFEVS